MRLDKDDKKRRDELVEALTEAKAALEAAIVTFNAQFADAKRPVDAAVDAYNEALAEAREWRDGRVETWNGDFDERSEKWQEGARGEAARAFIDGWEELDLDDVDVDLPDDIEEPDLPHGDDMQELDDAPVTK